VPTAVSIATATINVPTFMGTPLIELKIPTVDPRIPTVSLDAVLTAVVGIRREDALATAFALRSYSGLSAEELATLSALPDYPTNTPSSIGPPPANTDLPRPTNVPTSTKTVVSLPR
jgi:hypothetical protein